MTRRSRRETRNTLTMWMRAWRYGWALPASMLGLTLAVLALARGRVRIVDGVVEAHGPALKRVLTTLVPLEGGAAAITFGHVVIARDQASLTLTRPHERAHVRQYERWGVLFFTAYVFASLYALATGGHYYLDNVFERQANVSSLNADGSPAPSRRDTMMQP